jgi:RNA polymerase sigma factor (sigma-70 family)
MAQGCCGLPGYTCLAAPSPRKSSRTHGWAFSTESTASRAARRSRRGCSASLRTPRRHVVFAKHAAHRFPRLQTMNPASRRPLPRSERALPGTLGRAPRQLGGYSGGPTTRRETLEVIVRTIERLPPSQRAVLSLRDLEGLGADEVCNALDLTETNGRVLLHRARAKVRAALEEYLR